MSPHLEKILMRLNFAQKQAVEYGSGPLVIFAGAGSGKTMVITTRIATLIESGVKPQSILAVTFTNKAAREMKDRLRALTPLGEYAHLGTFHSACARWLREFSAELGFQSDFSIYDENDSISAIKSTLKELQINTDDHPPAQYRQAIGKAKTYAWLPSDAEKHQQDYAHLFPPMWVAVYKKYQEYLAQCNAMDFDDLLMNMLLLLRSNVRVRDVLRQRYEYIMVDEYQDTNPTQFALIAYLVSEKRNLCVVGDDDQSIYSWRGADPSNILDFQKHYPGAREIRLEQNYRSTAHIIKAASTLIINNKQRAEKTLWTANESGTPIQLRIDSDGELEAHWVVDEIVSEKHTYAYEDVGVLYRTNAQSRIFEDCLRRKNIPYRIYGALRFYDRLEIKDVLAYFRLLNNRHDDVAFRRIINVPQRGIGKKALETVEALASSQNSSLMDAALALSKSSETKNASAKKICDFVALFTKFKTESSKVSLEQTLSILIQSIEYLTYVEKKFPENFKEKVGNIHELGAALAEYSSHNPKADLSQWLNDISLTGSEQEEEGGVCLMTLHSAKGLEFRRVYIVGVEEGLIPHANNSEDLATLEEERRLFYVGITRAKEKLTLSAARKRRVYDSTVSHKPSRFLKEIPNDCFDSYSQRFLTSQRATTDSTHYTSQNSDEAYDEGFDTGSFVYHPTYGKGVIEAFESDFGSEKAIVKFSDFGLRKVSVSHLEARS